MVTTSISLYELFGIGVATVTGIFFLIKHLMEFSKQLKMEIKTNEAQLIQNAIEKVVIDFKSQVESLRNDMKNIGNNFRNFQDTTTKIIDKIEFKTDENKSKNDKLEGKLDFIEKHNAELDKKIEEKVKLVFLDTSKIHS